MEQPGAGARGTVPLVLGRGLDALGLRAELDHAFAQRPRAVVCHLGGADVLDVDLVRVFAPVVRFLVEWPGSAVVLVPPDERVRNLMLGTADGARVLLANDERSGVIEALGGLPGQQDVELALGPSFDAPGMARAFARSALRGWGLADLLDPTCLVVSELVTNAVIHAGTELRLSLSMAASRVLITVHDHHAGAPRTGTDLSMLDFGGRGLLIVEEFAKDWGIFPTQAGGKLVWAVVADPPEY